MFRWCSSWLTRWIAALAFLTATSFAAAAPITFTHSGTGSGSIGATNFTNADFVITATGDTNGRVAFSSGFFINHLSAQIGIGGVGVFTFTTATRTFVNDDSNIVGFSRTGIFGADLFSGPIDAAFDGWDMLSSIGPIVGTGNLLQWSLSPVETSGGTLLFDSGSSGATFQATVAVPEPGTLALLGLSVAGLAFTRRRKQ